ncbi:hypothetical protein ACU4GH_17715 [Bradyrhizobium betae]
MRHLPSFRWLSPRRRQKYGGSITVGRELEIAGFDPLKVGVYDTSTFTAAAAIFDTLTTAGRQGRGRAKARGVLDPF